jgi:putative ABC transport system permease protein
VADGEPAGRVRDALARRLDDPSVRITAFDEAQPGLRRFFTQLTGYLGLVGLASLLIGGIGVAVAVAASVRRQLFSIAILKSLGAGSRILIVAVLVQTQAVSLLAGLVGAAIGVLVQPALGALLAGILPFALDPRPDPLTVARGVAMGMLTALLCALWPVLAIRDVRPSLILRRNVERAASRRRPWLAAAPIAAGLAGLAVWQAGALTLGAIFLGAAAGALLVLLGVAQLAVRAVRAVPRPRGVVWRHGLAALARPGGHTTRVTVALGAGVMLLAAVAQLQASLGAHIDHERRREAPSFFFVDVQPDQRDEFARLVSERSGGASPVLTPVVRARLAGVDGRALTRTAVDVRKRRDAEGAGYFTREYALTWAETPPPGALVRGRWWTPAEAAARPWVSVEDTAARHLGVDIGSRLTFDIQGVSVEAEVMSLRKVDWQSFTTNFFMVLSPGALDGAPAVYVATARVPVAAERPLQDAVVAAFPNVTAIPLRDVLARVAGVLGDIAVAVRLIALFAIATGVVVLVGSLASTRYQRLYESVVLRALGATRGVVARTFAVEYACLGAAAGVGGTALAALLAWVVLQFVLEIPWAPGVGPWLLGPVLTMAVAVLVGFLTTFRLLGERPLSVLRQE